MYWCLSEGAAVVTAVDQECGATQYGPMIWIAHMTPSCPPSYPQYEFWSYGLPGTILTPWMYCVTQLDSILHAAEIITTYSR